MTSPIVTSLPPVPRFEDTLLFIKDSQSKPRHETSDKEPFDLYSIVDGEVVLQARGLVARYLISPNGKMIANFEYHKGWVDIVSLSAYGEATISAFDILGSIKDVSWSPDSTRLAVVNTEAAYVLSVPRHQVQTIAKDEYVVSNLETGPDNISWSPDGTQLAYDTYNGAPLPMYLHQLPIGRPSELAVADADGQNPMVLDKHGAHPVWSPDGKRILYAGGPCRTDNEENKWCNETLFSIKPDGTSGLSSFIFTVQATHA